MKVYDCFPFYNEFDLLEIRLEELWDVVDYFVIAEADKTHQHNPKPYYLSENWDRVKKYESKIRVVKVDDMPNHPNTWVGEKHQRRSLIKGLWDRQPDDLICTSDCDEIPRAEAIAAIKEDANDYNRYILGMPMFYFKLNFMQIHPHPRQRHIVVTRGRSYIDPQAEREFTFYKDNHPTIDYSTNSVMLDHAGWHFTYFGDDDFARNKLKNFAHAESNVPEIVDNVNLDYMIANKVGFMGFNHAERFEYIRFDDYFPEYVIKNQEKYKDKIILNATHSVDEFYPMSK